MLAVGANGVGKTNLLEALHVATQGFSPRTHSDAQLVRFSSPAARVAVAGTRRGGNEVTAEVVIRPGEGKRARLNGEQLRAAELLRTELTTLVFTPDRVAVVKGGPAVRRAYFDRALARLLPARGALAAEYAVALAQRNAALRRISLGFSSRDALEPWTERVATLGAALVAARHETAAALSPVFAARAEELDLRHATVAYRGEPVAADALRARVDRDVERGATGLGPHLDDFAIAAGDRDLRTYGSQGEQRLAVLALILAEAEILAERRGERPLLLLDDVLSELDPRRRRALAERVAGSGQALITATSASALPTEPRQVLAVEPGAVTAA